MILDFVNNTPTIQLNVEMEAILPISFPKNSSEQNSSFNNIISIAKKNSNYLLSNAQWLFVIDSPSLRKRE